MQDFFTQAQRIRERMIRLALDVEAMVHDATQAVLERNPDVEQPLRARRTAWSVESRELEENALAVLALHQPVAQDLRMIVCLVKILNDLQRMLSLANGLAMHAKALAAAPEIRPPFDLELMVTEVRAMLQHAITALRNFDAPLAQIVRELDDNVDDAHRLMYAQVIEAIQAEPDHTDPIIRYQGISRQLERLADLATNIAKDVIFLAEGRIVRHESKRNSA